MSLDGFWMGEDGTLLVFKPHYLFKERMLFFVESGVLTKVDQDVTLKNGAVLCTDATLLTPSGRLVRLDDGYMLTANGDPISGLDHVAIADGKLVLQKDGSIIPLPVVSTIGMSDGTRVRGDGLVTWSSGYQFRFPRVNGLPSKVQQCRTFNEKGFRRPEKRNVKNARERER